MILFYLCSLSKSFYEYDNIFCLSFFVFQISRGKKETNTQYFELLFEVRVSTSKRLGVEPFEPFLNTFIWETVSAW
jgi:hypothetical protein